MSLKSILIGSQTRQPFEGHVEYAGGTVATFPVWAENMRDAMRLIRDVLPEQKPVIQLTIRRVETEHYEHDNSTEVSALHERSEH